VAQKAVDDSLLAAGLAGRVLHVDRVQDADAVLAVKCTPAGKHINLLQVRAWCLKRRR
jgi:hypothetical protein